MQAGNLALLLVMMEPTSHVEEEFNEWYDTEHIPERMSVPGFLSSGRYVTQEGCPKYLSVFDLENSKVLESDEYIKMSPASPSPWTRRMFRHVRGVKRYVYDQISPGNILTSNKADGMLLIVEDLASTKEKEINQWYEKEHIPRLMAMEGVINIRRFVCIEGSPKYLTLYAFDDIESLRYNYKIEIKQRTSQFRNHIENVKRSIYRRYIEQSFNHIKYYIS